MARIFIKTETVEVVTVIEEPDTWDTPVMRRSYLVGDGTVAVWRETQAAWELVQQAIRGLQPSQPPRSERQEPC